MKRLFVFGCSLTRYGYATWADLASANFDQYYNYARSGGSNSLMMGRLVEANNEFNFNEDTDTVLIMMTGIGRYSYYLKDAGWVAKGDMYSYIKNSKDEPIESFLKNMHSDKGDVYNSWISIKIIKDLLVTKNIPHKILLGISYNDYLMQNEYNDEESIRKVMDIQNMLDETTPLNDWFNKKENYGNEPNTPYYTESQKPDGHPNQRMHYEFLKKFLPEYDTDKTKELFNYVESIFDGRTQHKQEETYRNKFYKQYNKAFSNHLFGMEQESW
jgi:hypothetical protein